MRAMHCAAHSRRRLPAFAGSERTTRSPSPASRSSPIPPARSIGRTKGCSSSPICIWKRARPSPRAACCCRPTTRRRRWRGSRASSSAMRRGRDRAGRQLPRRRRAGAHGRRRPRDAQGRCSAAATGSGSPAITIPICRADIGGRFADVLALGPLTFRHEPSANARATARSPAICIRSRASRSAGAR